MVKTDFSNHSRAIGTFGEFLRHAVRRETVLASSFYSQYGLPTISGLPLHDGKGRYRPEKSMTDSQKVSRSW
ncbi:hypothetical protein TNCV_3988071 [Trichonephila clavipes]|nr:hypothetical protein TNCV_3988071 [Trichonephila clavipes]